MELERELRHIAYNNQTDISSRPFGVTGIARELVSREILPAIWLEPLEEITRVCNRAIHGGTEVPDDIAASVVRVGGQLLEQLRSVRKQWRHIMKAAIFEETGKLSVQDKTAPNSRFRRCPN